MNDCMYQLHIELISTRVMQLQSSKLQMFIHGILYNIFLLVILCK